MMFIVTYKHEYKFVHTNQHEAYVGIWSKHE